MRDTIDMAREAGFNFDGMLYTVRGNHVQLAHLEALVRADEREACAKVCEENADDGTEGEWDSACISCANHVRARGQA